MTYTLHQLGNQLKLILAPMKSSKAVTVLFLVKAGSKYETKPENGISHFLEHMFFKGTKKRPSTLIISETLDRVGGIYNAFTDKEYTGFYIKLAYPYLPLAMDVLSDMLLNSLFKQEEVEKEKGVILEEMKLYQDTPTAYIEDVFEKLLYGNTPAGREIIGPKENINRFSSSQIKLYLKTHYSAKNSLVVIAGKIKPNETLSLAKQYFGSFPLRKIKDKKKVEEKQLFPQLSISPKKTDQTHLCLGVRTFNLFDKRRYPMAVLDAILGGGMSSRLFINIRERRGLAYYIRTRSETYSDSGYFAIQAGINHKNIESVVKLILAELRLLKTELVPEKELQKAKDYIKGTTLLGLETSNNIASFLGMQKLLRDQIENPTQIFRHINQVTAHQIQSLANEIFLSQNLNLALITPRKNISLRDDFKKTKL